MSARLMGEILSDKCDLTGNLRLTLLALADCANQDNECYPSLEYIRRAVNVATKETVQKYIRQLVKDGYIERTHRFRRNKQTSNLYKIIKLSVRDVRRDVGGTSVETPIGTSVETSRTLITEPLPKPSEGEPAVSTTKHPLVQTYKDIARIFPNTLQRDIIIERIKDAERWKWTVQHWMGHGWSKVNVASMIELYDRGHCTACKERFTGGVVESKPERVEETNLALNPGW